MKTELIVRHLRAAATEARTSTGRHGTALVTVWQIDRAADELERLAARVAELEAQAAERDALFDLTTEPA
jgi:uncharacterized protein YigA (DUF484 family)